jgi:BirA family biotin operon repressor/biotin-[acetyl-CoA-carboxylase] ligase
VADFACFGPKLVVELDGEPHDFRRRADERRDGWLENFGFRILRFQNIDVLTNLAGVVNVIDDNLDELLCKSVRGRVGQ